MPLNNYQTSTYLLLKLLVYVYVFFLGACARSSVNPVVLTQKPTYPIETVLQQEAFQSHQPLEYKGLVPGKSIREDVISVMGLPNVTKKYHDYESLHYFIAYDPLIHGQEYFLMKNNVLIAVTSDLHKRRDSSVLNELPALFPNADVIQPSFGLQTYVLPQHGLAFSIYTYQFFIPMKLEEYKLLWQDYPINVDPFPIDEISPDNKEVKPGETTQSDLIKLFGMPDRIVEETTNIRWLYMVEADTYGRLDVSFDESNVIDSMFIEYMEESLTLQGGADRYGKPDVVQLMKVYSIDSFDSISFVYLKRGLRLSSYCDIPNCESGSFDLFLSQKWFFPPVSLEKYRLRFPESVFIEWEDFFSSNQ